MKKTAFLFFALISIFLFIRCAAASEDGPKMEILTGIVAERPGNIKNSEAWNAPPGLFYYVLEMDDPAGKTVLLRPSEQVKTEYLKKLTGLWVTLHGYRVAGKPCNPVSPVEQYPVEPVIHMEPGGEKKLIGYQPARRGSGFVVTAVSEAVPVIRNTSP